MSDIIELKITDDMEIIEDMEIIDDIPEDLFDDTKKIKKSSKGFKKFINYDFSNNTNLDKTKDTEQYYKKVIITDTKYGPEMKNIMENLDVTVPKKKAVSKKKVSKKKSTVSKKKVSKKKSTVSKKPVKKTASKKKVSKKPVKKSTKK